MVGDNAERYYQGYYSEDYDDTYYGKGQLTRGRIEVCIDGRYGTICDDNWDYEDASVVCLQLGFSPYGSSCYTNLKHNICAYRCSECECARFLQ